MNKLDASDIYLLQLYLAKLKFNLAKLKFDLAKLKLNMAKLKFKMAKLKFKLAKLKFKLAKLKFNLANLEKHIKKEYLWYNNFMFTSFTHFNIKVTSDTLMFTCHLNDLIM